MVMARWVALPAALQLSAGAVDVRTVLKKRDFGFRCLNGEAGDFGRSKSVLTSVQSITSLLVVLCILVL
jgi:hypothetical protein